MLVAFSHLHLSSSDLSAQCLPLPLPLIFCMLWRITFRCQDFLKGMGYLRCRRYVRRYDSCSTVDGPSWAGCESTPLVTNLLIFSAVHQRVICHGGQQESLGYCRVISHEEIHAPGTRNRRVILLQEERAAPGNRCLRKATVLAPSFYFSIFYQHQFDNQ